MSGHNQVTGQGLQQAGAHVRPSTGRQMLSCMASKLVTQAHGCLARGITASVLLSIMANNAALYILRTETNYHPRRCSTTQALTYAADADTTGTPLTLLNPPGPHVCSSCAAIVLHSVGHKYEVVTLPCCPVGTTVLPVQDGSSCTKCSRRQRSLFALLQLSNLAYQ